MTELPLSGLRIVVCRPREQAGALVGLLTEFGAEAVCAPVITIVDPADGGAALTTALSGLQRGDWLVLTSPNGAARASAVLNGQLPSGVNVATIGPGTDRRAREAGLRVHLVPNEGVAEGLLTDFPPPNDVSRRVVIARAAVARETLPVGLREAGWDVTDVAAYQTVASDLSEADRRMVISADGVVFTSSSTVDRLVDAVGSDAVPPLVTSIGPATSRTIERHGLEVSVEAAEHTIDGVVEALVEFAASWPD